MRRLFFFIIILFTGLCYAQKPSSITVNVKGVKFEMVKIAGDMFTHQNLYGDTIYKGYHLAPIDSLRVYNGYCKIQLSDYYVGKFEVTQELYEKVMGKNPSWYGTFDNQKKDAPKHPVENVTWNDAMAFIDSLNKITGFHFRLPTEMEWEYAASGGNLTHLYSGGNDNNAVAWGWDNGWQRSHTVGSKSPNEFGLYDMSGNVCEWCNDWFSPYFYEPDKLYVNPTGPQAGKMKVEKGGSWGNFNRFLEYKTRVGDYPNHKTGGSGFRLAMDAK